MLHGVFDRGSDEDPDHLRRDALGVDEMRDFFKNQTFRVIMVLSALASSALVIEAGQRWK